MAKSKVSYLKRTIAFHLWKNQTIKTTHQEIQKWAKLGQLIIKTNLELLRDNHA